MAEHSTTTVIRTKPQLKRTRYACVNCKAAKAACDECRPCAWCIRHEMQDTCVDAPRKVRTNKRTCCTTTGTTVQKKISFHAYQQQPTTTAHHESHDHSAPSHFSLPPSLAPFSPSLSSITPASTEVIPIEDLLLQPVNIDVESASNALCYQCPLFLICTKDAPQRIICATSLSSTSGHHNSDLSPALVNAISSSSSGPSSLLQEIEDCPSPPHLSPLPNIPQSPSPMISSMSDETVQLSPPFTEMPSSAPFSPSAFTLSSSANIPSSPAIEPSSPASAPLSSESYYSSEDSYTPVATPPVYTPPQQQQQQQQQQVSTPVTTIAKVTTPTQTPPKAQSKCCRSQQTPLSSSSNALLDTCSCEDLVKTEMAKISTSLETISALMQLQSNANPPVATFHLCDMTIEDCNDDFARALGYDDHVELLTLPSLQMLRLTENQDSDSEMRSESDESEGENDRKPQLTAFLPQNGIPGFMKCVKTLQSNSIPVVTHMTFTAKNSEQVCYTVFMKPAGSFSYISLIKKL